MLMIDSIVGMLPSDGNRTAWRLTASGHHELSHHTVIFVLEDVAVIHIGMLTVPIIGHLDEEFGAAVGRHEEDILVAAFPRRDIGSGAVSLRDGEMGSMNMKIVVHIHCIAE